MTAFAEIEHYPSGHVERDGCLVRDLTSRDLGAVKQLFHEGLLPGHTVVDPADCERLEQLLQASSAWRFWVAEVGGRIVGTVAIAAANRDVVQLRWLRVAPAWQADRRVAQSLVAAAVGHVRETGYLKLVLHAPPDVHPENMAYFEYVGFMFSRIIRRGGWNVLEFLLDLYRDPDARAPGSPARTNRDRQAGISQSSRCQRPTDPQEALHGQHQE